MHVTVLMPAFNAERFLSEAVESVLAQSHADFELLVVDDGSEDSTLAISESYRRRDHRVRVITHPNMGMGASLNAAFEETTSEWIVRMDADDVMLPDRLRRQIVFVTEVPAVDVAGTLVYYIDEGGRVLGGSPQSPLSPRSMGELEGRPAADAAALPLIAPPKLSLFHSTVIMRRSAVRAVGGYRPQFWPCDDLDLWNRMLEQGHTVAVQPEYLLKYRRHGSSGSVARARHMWLKVHWVEACTRSRRSGEPEPRWDDFLATRRRRPLPKRVDQERQDLGNEVYSLALALVSRRRYFRGAVALLGALLLRPVYVARRVLRLT